MAGYKIDTTAGGTGTFTISTPNSNSDRTLALPDEAGTVLTSASAVASSQIATALNASGSAPLYACRAWVNFNGTGTVAIRNSGNVSSITDGGTGFYTVNFTTSMPDTDYCVTSVTNANVTVDGDERAFLCPRNLQTGYVTVNAINDGGTKADNSANFVAVHR